MTDTKEHTVIVLVCALDMIPRSVIPGWQSEQLALILLDRVKKLNAKYPSDQNSKQIEGLEMYLAACKERIEERINRGVMGELKK